MSASKVTTFRIFNIPKKILDSIRNNPSFEKLGASIEDLHHKNRLRLENIKAQNLTLLSETISCNLCGNLVFNSFLEQREHYKSETHLKNLSKKIDSNNPEAIKKLDILSSLKKLSLDDNNLSSKGGDSSDLAESDLFQDSFKTNDSNASRIWFSTFPDINTETANSSNIAIDQNSKNTLPETNKIDQYGVYKAVLFDKRSKSHSSSTSLFEELTNLQFDSKGSSQQQTDIYWSILLLSGGHFAAGVFNNKTGKLIAHKTIHRYTTRKKQGKSQLSHDKAKNRVAKSAGAQIRRYNEQKLLDEVNETLNSWKPYLLNSSRIFQSTSKASRRVFFGGQDSVLLYDSPAIRICPIQIKRPTLDEVSKVYESLSSVFIRKVDPVQRPQSLSSKLNGTTADGKAAESPLDLDQHTLDDLSESSDFESDGTLEPEPRPELVAFLYEAAATIQDKSKSNEQVLNYLETNKEMLLDAFLDPATELRYLEKCPSLKGNKTPTLLFLATVFERPESIIFLLDHGDDPSITNGHPPIYSSGKTAYEMAPNRSIRDVFRKYRFDNEVVFEHSLNPSDLHEFSEWDSSRIPRGWKEPDPTKMAAEASIKNDKGSSKANKGSTSKSQANQKQKEPKKQLNKSKQASKQSTNTSATASTSASTNNSQVPNGDKNPGILNSLKTNRTKLPNPSGTKNNTFMSSSQFSISSGKTLATSTRRMQQQSRTLQGDLAAQRELRAKAAEARLARLQ
ncbi:Protein vms-1 [Smittium culicis]|uniref:Protein vms-1 n=1 Tax=Smittium culicis TaxID=133412 RepID=A0A1R1YNY4_9FUNG|nr:Protein vms-1 [Smittium culicis]